MKTITVLMALLLPIKAMNSVRPQAMDPESTLILTTEERIVKVLRDSGYSRVMQRIILAQAKTESGVFTNRLTVRHKNIFAILHSKKRQTLSLGSYGHAEGRLGYCVYLSIDSAVADYILYKKHRGIPNAESPEQYVRELKRRRYFESDAREYLLNVKRHMRADSTVRNFSPD